MDRCEPASGVPGRGHFDATVLSNTALCREHFRLRLHVRGRFPRTAPGQFVQLACRPPDATIDAEVLHGRDATWTVGEPGQVRQFELREPVALLRRPFSIAGRGDNEQGTWLELIHRVVGHGTRWLSSMRPGDPLDLLGPLGNRFDLPPDRSFGLLVGGGVGLPPMFYLAEELAAHGWDAVCFVGARTGDLLAVTLQPGAAPDAAGRPTKCVAQFARHSFATVLSTDDGSVGLRGRITDGLARHLAHLDAAARRRSVLFACGPEPMMREAARLAAGHGVPAQVCLEQAMACGLGTCQSCVVRIDPGPGGPAPQGHGRDGRPWRFMLACTDGPVFDAARVVW